MDVAASAGVNPAALFVNSTSASGVGLYVVQTNSSDAAVVINSWTGDIIKGFGRAGVFGPPNTQVFTVDVNGNVTAQSFNSTSDRKAKENFTAINPTEVLAKVAALPISEWNFKTEPADQRHLGPMAQDFHAAFGLNGQDDKHISTVDESGIALAAIQGLNEKLEAQKAENVKLKQQNDSLTERFNELEAMVKKLAAQR